MHAALEVHAPDSLIGGDVIREMVAIAWSTPPGAMVEVGVYKGGSAWYLAQLARDQNRTLYLCDTFTGIPYCDEDKGDKHRVGDFGDVDFEHLKSVFSAAGFDHWVRWVKGVFPYTELPGQFSFAHLDCDQYKSVKESCEWLIPRMVPGGVIWFDDVDRLDGATRAATELFGSRLQRDMSHPYVRL